MVRPPSFDSNGMKKGAWSEDEDNKLRAYIVRYGHWNWRLLPKYAGLKRCGKSCRLRWVNYLKPGVKRGSFTKEEQDLVIKLHAELGNKWSAIAAKLPGRTDNEIKNFWHTRVERRHKPNQAHKRTAARPSSAEASSMNFSEDFRQESDSSEATSVITQSQPSDANPSLSTNSQDQLDLMLSVLEADTNYDQLFDYPELHYSELSSSGSSYINYWTADEDDQLIGGSFWNDPSTSNASISEISECSDYTPLQEEGLLYCDPLLQFFDYEMSRFC